MTAAAPDPSASGGPGGPAGPDPATFLSGESGTVGGVRRTAAATAADAWLGLRHRLARMDRDLDLLVQRSPERSVLAMCVYRSRSELAARAAEELRHSRHRVRLAFGSMGRARGGLEAHTLATGLSGGKLQNLNEIWALAQPPGWPAPDWVVAIDDDIVLPERFLDRFLAVCEAFHLKLAQPAQTRRSHAAWRVTRRRAGSLARETRFVEIGPVTAFAREAARELVPFPDLRYGWGLDSHWGALADERGWRLGVVDAVPVRHEHRPVSADYPHAEAVAEARRFLAGRPHLRAEQAQETLRVHRDPPGGRPRGRRGRGRRRDGGEAQA